MFIILAPIIICSALSIFAITWAVIRGDFFHVTDKGREWVLEHTENVFILTDNTYGYLDANLYAKELFPSLKYTKKNKTIPEDVLQYFAEGENCIEIGEKHFTKKLSPIVQAGRTLGYSLLLIDVTYQFEMMDQITEEKRKAEAANHAKSAFMSNMSHEIRTPMNSIVGMTDIALREDVSEHTKECLNNIKSSGNALLTIINDILDFSKIEAGKMDIINETYEPMSSLNDISMIFLNRIGDKDIELLYDIDVNLPRKLCGDAQRIRQVIINLMNNAIKFTDCGFVKLSVKVEEVIDNKAKLLYSIEDSGQGIKPEDVQYINAHGTSTGLNDPMETRAAKAVFGEHAYKLKMSSTKSMTGHLLGATGALEALVCLKAINDNFYPPTINYNTPDPDCDLDMVPNKGIEAPLDIAMTNTLGFGGHNSSLILRRA